MSIDTFNTEFEERKNERVTEVDLIRFIFLSELERNRCWMSPSCVLQPTYWREDMPSRRTLTSLRSGPMQTSWCSARFSVRSFKWVGAISITNTGCTKRLRTALRRKSLSIKKYKTAVHTCYPESWIYPVLHEEKCDQQVKGDSDCHSSWVRPSLVYRVQLWSPQHKKDMDLLEWVQRKAVRIIRGLEHCEVRLRESR